MKQKTLLSIIVPVYKVEPYLSRCIESITAQTYKNLEIILVDDGSPDRCGEICEAYAAQDQRIKVFHTENRGLSAARNLGIQHAKGEYIGFVDSDDWIEPDMYEILLKAAEESGAEIVQCGYYKEKNRLTEAKISVAKTYTSTEALHALVLYGKINEGVWNKLWEKSCFAEISFPEGRVFEDISTTYKLTSKANSVISKPVMLYHYMYRDEGISHSHNIANLVDYWLAHKERYECFSNNTCFNKNEMFINQLLQNCAVAMARTIRWLYAVPVKEREPYITQLEEMHNFNKQCLKKQKKDNWPLYVQLCLVLENKNNTIVLPLMYGLCQAYKKLHNL